MLEKIFESHAHYDDKAFDSDRDKIITSLHDSYIERIINVGASVDSNRRTIEIINKYDFIIPIPGSRKIERLQSNFEAGNVELSQEEVKTIDDKLNTMEFKVFGGH